MSPRIHLLPEELIARIAAGEVVDRPASIVKELVENSLDAGATHIEVSFEGAGRTLIRVSDNGCGMTIGEALLSLQRHATSKIGSFEDLESVRTYGFRGEAVPSIASVSKMNMITRPRQEELGWDIYLEGGKVISEKPVAREPGTTIEIRNIFFNTPARYKFLKSDMTERSQIMKVIEDLAFAAPHVSFEVQAEKAKPLFFSGRMPESYEDKIQSLKSRVTEAWGNKWERGLEPILSKSPHFLVYGVITHQGFHQASNRSQYFYVNNRPVNHRRFTRAIYDAYLGQLPGLRHPGWVLFLELDPKTVDVNVHPSKREVKLTHENEIFQFLLQSVKKALRQTSEAPVQVFPVSQRQEASISQESGHVQEGFSESSSYASKEKLGDKVLRDVYRPHSDSPISINEVIHPALFEESVVENNSIDLKDPELKALSQVNDMFIIAHNSQGLMIVDQHAAAEKVVYEKLLSNLESNSPQTQMLLVPFTWEVALSATHLVMEHLSHFQNLGFVIEPFGGQTFLVKGVPAVSGEKFDLHELLDTLSEVLLNPTDKRGGLERGIQHRLAAAAACKSSVRAGDRLQVKDCESLLKQLSNCLAPYTCPHGRPTIIRLPYSELEHRFRRK